MSEKKDNKLIDRMSSGGFGKVVKIKKDNVRRGKGKKK